MQSLLKKIIILGVISSYLSCAQIYAQEPAAPAAPVKLPVMRSIFWNTVLGSGWGAIMGVAAALSSPQVPFRDSLILGTTLGGMIGYGFGVFLVIRGITFDPSTLPLPPTTPLGVAPPTPTHPIAQTDLLPFSSEMKISAQQSPQQWKTTIFQMTF